MNSEALRVISATQTDCLTTPNQEDCVEKMFQQAFSLRRQKKYEEAIRLFNECIQREEAPKFFFIRSSCFYCTNRYDLALCDIERAISIEPENVQYYGAKVAILNMQKQYDRALQACNSALELFPKHQTILLARGVFHKHLLLYHQAKLDFMNCISLAKHNCGDAYQECGKVCTLLKQWKIAAECYSKAFELNFERASSAHLCGLAYNSWAKPQQALLWYEKSLALNKTTCVLRDKALLLCNQHKYQESLDTYKLIKEDEQLAEELKRIQIFVDTDIESNRSEDPFTKAYTLAKMNRYFEALSLLNDKCETIDRADFVEVMRLKHTCYIHLQDWKNVIKFKEFSQSGHSMIVLAYHRTNQWRELIVLVCSMKQEELTSQNLIYRGLAYQALGISLCAVADFEAALTVNKNSSNNAVAYNELHCIYSARGDYSRSLDYINRAIETDQRNSTFFCNRCNILQAQRKSYIDDINRSIELEPSNALYYQKRSAYFDGINKKESSSFDLACYEDLVQSSTAFARFLMSCGRIKDAQEELSHQLHSSSTFQLKMQCHIKLKQLDLAAQHAKHIYELDRTNLSGLRFRCKYFFDSHQYHSCVIECNLLLKIDPHEKHILKLKKSASTRHLASLRECKPIPSIPKPIPRPAIATTNTNTTTAAEIVPSVTKETEPSVGIVDNEPQAPKTRCKICFKDLYESQKRIVASCTSQCSLDIHYSCWVNRKRSVLNWSTCVTPDCNSLLFKCILLENHKETCIHVPKENAVAPRLPSTLSLNTNSSNHKSASRTHAQVTPSLAVAATVVHETPTPLSTQITLVPHAKTRDWIKNEQKYGTVTGHLENLVFVKLEGSDQNIIQCSTNDIVGDFPQVDSLVMCSFSMGKITLSLVSLFSCGAPLQIL